MRISIQADVGCRRKSWVVQMAAFFYVSFVDNAGLLMPTSK